MFSVFLFFFSSEGLWKKESRRAKLQGFESGEATASDIRAETETVDAPTVRSEIPPRWRWKQSIKRQIPPRHISPLTAPVSRNQTRGAERSLYFGRCCAVPHHAMLRRVENAMESEGGQPAGF